MKIFIIYYIYYFIIFLLYKIFYSLSVFKINIIFYSYVKKYKQFLYIKHNSDSKTDLPDLNYSQLTAF